MKLEKAVLIGFFEFLLERGRKIIQNRHFVMLARDSAAAINFH